MQLNARQTDVLQWIAAGRPERNWPDWTHRTTAKALQSRGLVRVRGHGPTWTAEVTDLGRLVLAGEPLPRSSGEEARWRKRSRPASAAELRDSSQSETAVRIDPVDLLADLTEAEE